MEEPTAVEILKDANRLDPTGLLRVGRVVFAAFLWFGFHYFERNPAPAEWYWTWFVLSLAGLIEFALSEFVIARRRDELERMIIQRSGIAALYVTLCAATVLAMLEIRFGYPIPLPAPGIDSPDHFGLKHIVFVGLFSYVIATVVHRRRLSPG